MHKDQLAKKRKKHGGTTTPRLSTLFDPKKVKKAARVPLLKRIKQWLT